MKKKLCGINQKGAFFLVLLLCKLLGYTLLEIFFTKHILILLFLLLYCGVQHRFHLRDTLKMKKKHIKNQADSRWPPYLRYICVLLFIWWIKKFFVCSLYSSVEFNDNLCDKITLDWMNFCVYMKNNIKSKNIKKKLDLVF